MLRYDALIIYVILSYLGKLYGCRRAVLFAKVAYYVTMKISVTIHKPVTKET